MGRVQDSVVIVTGGAGGIGAAACRAIAAEGGKVVVADLDATRRGPSRTRSSRTAARHVRRRRRHRSRAGAGDGPDGRRHVRRAQRDLQQRRDEPAPRLHGGRRGELRRDRPRQHLGRDRLHAGGGEADDRAGLRRKDRQHRVDRQPAGVLGLRPVLRREVRHARRHSGNRPRPDRARDHGQRLRSGRRRHPDVGRAQRGHPSDPRRSPPTRTRCATSPQARSSGARPHRQSWRRFSSTSPLPSRTT